MDNQISLCDGSYNVAGNDGHLSSDEMWHPCLFFTPNYSQEEYHRGVLSSSCGWEEADVSSSDWNENELAEENYGGEQQLPYYGCGNWFREYEDSLSGSWGDGYFSPGNGVHNSEGDTEMKKDEEDSAQCRQEHESNSWHGGVTQEYPTCDYNNWSYDSWFGYGGKTDYPGQEESRTSHSYHPPDMGVFEGIFGYWPCLYRQWSSSNF